MIKTGPFKNLSRATKMSIRIATSFVCGVSTVLSLFGLSLRDILNFNFWNGMIILSASFLIIYYISFLIIKTIYKDSIRLKINNTNVLVKKGDIFKTPGWKVIGCDTHFDFRIDDIVINKNSLHGIVFVEHGNQREIEKAIEEEAARLKIERDENNQYNFNLGSIVKYESSIDHETYLLLAMNELDRDSKAIISMNKFEQMLMKMWSEIDRVYAHNDIVIPLLGSKNTRFKEGPRSASSILKCMLCTLGNSKADIWSKVTIVLRDFPEPLDLLELKYYEK